MKMNWLTRAQQNDPEPAEVVVQPADVDTPRQSADLLTRHIEAVEKTRSWLLARREDLQDQIAFLQEELRQNTVVYEAHTASAAVLKQGTSGGTN